MTNAQTPQISEGVVCSQCGALLKVGTNFSDLFYVGQLNELEQPDYFHVNHLNVPYYILQHDAYLKQC